MELSFSKQAKLEVLDNYKIPKATCCKENFIKGYLYDDVKLENFTDIVLQPDVNKSAKLVKKIMVDLAIESYIVTKEKATNKSTTFIYITEQESVQKAHQLLRTKIGCEKCAHSFLVGLFIMNGTLSNPEKEYQLEIVLSEEDKCAKTLALLYKLGFVFKMTQRRKGYVLYTKNSETIEDFMATIGAQNTCLEIMSSKVVKDIRNKVNRITNCETANIAKTSKASTQHVLAINTLIQSGKMELLSEDLQEIAYLKLDNPELSLTELAALTTPPLTKSSLNRRLQKICELAKLEEK